MSQAIIKLAIGFHEPRPIFHLRRISENEERKFLARIADIQTPGDPEAVSKHEADTAIEGLAEWNTSPLTKAIGDGSEPFYTDTEETPADQVRRYFRECEDAGDDVVRLARRALVEYQIKLQPDVSFF
jgi:hypothetical protein